MPLSINVGLSRKASKDFQSTGVSINFTAELDQSLLARPDELQEQIHGLYAQAEKALDRQGNSGGSQTNGQSPVRNGYGQRAGQPRNGNGHSGNGRTSRGNGG
jgi:hypothetical protein